MKKRFVSLLLAALLCVSLLPTGALSAFCGSAPASFSLSPEAFSLATEDFDEGYASLTIKADSLVLGTVEWNGEANHAQRLDVSPIAGKLTNNEDRKLAFRVFTGEGNGDGTGAELGFINAGEERSFRFYIDPAVLAAVQPGVYTGSLICRISWAPMNAAAGTVSIPVTLTVTQRYTVTVNGGSGGGDYAEGDSVTVTANEPETGKRFLEWKGADGLTFTEGGIDTATATFIMPAEAVTLTVKYANIPPASFSLSPDAFSLTPEDFEEGYASLAIKADRLVLGMVEWNEEPYHAEKLDVSITSGDLTIGDGRKLHFQLFTEEVYGEGNSVELSYSDPREEKAFQLYIDPDKLAAAGPGVYTGSLTCSTSWTPMNAPGDPVSVSLTLTVPEPVYTVTVNGGSGGGNYAEGESVTITANDPEADMRFLGWAWICADGLTFTEGGIDTATATFIMPAGPVTFSALYTEYEGYTVTLKPGDGSGNDVVIHSDEAGRTTYYYLSLAKGQFFGEGGRFWFMLPDCPFSPPEGESFLGWVFNGQRFAPGELIEMTEIQLTLTAAWGAVSQQTYVSYSLSSPSSVVLSGEDSNRVPYSIDRLVMGRLRNRNVNADYFEIYFYAGELKSADGETIPYRVENYDIGYDSAIYNAFERFVVPGSASVFVFLDPEACADAAPGIYSGTLHYDCKWWTSQGICESGGSGSIVLFLNTLEGDVCTVTLSPGTGGGAPIILNPDVDGVAQSKETALNCRFYHEDGGGLGFRLDAAYCPSTFTAPEGGYIFNGWNESTGYITLSEGAVIRTANWQQSPVTLSPASVTLTGAGDNTFTLTPAVHNGGRYASLGFSSGTLKNGTQTIPFTCSGEIGRREEPITVFVDPSAYATAAPGQYTGWLNYSGRVTMQQGTAPVRVSGAIPLLLVVPERPRYAVEITGGDGGGSYAEGESVTIMANEPESGKQFKVWSGAEGLSFTAGDMYSATATFTMPANAVTLTATYENAVSQLDVAKSTAKAELENYKDPADYRPAQQTELESAISAGKNAIDAAADTDAVAAALAAAKTVIDAIKTDAQLTAEETLAAAKTTAKTELAAYKNAADYRSAQQTELTNAIETGNTKIDAAATIAEVNTALANAKAAIDAIKTDAQLTAEEAAAADAANQAAADAVAAKIAAIGEVAYTNESKALIDEALAAYNALTAAQKELVSNYAALTAAEARYAELKAAAETPTDPTEPTEPENPDEPQAEDLCKWCGEPHIGFWGRFIKFFHSILFFFAHLFGKR